MRNPLKAWASKTRRGIAAILNRSEEAPLRTVLDEAAAITSGARRSHYGHPQDNHGCTAALYTAYLRRRGLLAPDGKYSMGGPEVDAHDVCILNMLQKISRDANLRTRDNLVDIAGYARNAEMLTEPREPVDVA